MSTETSYRSALLRNLIASVSALLFQIATHLLPFGVPLGALPFLLCTSRMLGFEGKALGSDLVSSLTGVICCLSMSCFSEQAGAL